MSESSPIRGQNNPPVIQQSFEKRTNSIQQSLMALATQTAEAKYQQQISSYKQKCDEVAKQNNALRHKLQQFRKNSQEAASIQQKQRQLQQRQRQIYDHEIRITNQLKRQSKEEQILKLQLKLKQDFNNQNLENSYAEAKNKLQNELRIVKNQRDIRMKQTQETKTANKVLVQKFKYLQNELEDTKAKFSALQSFLQAETKNRQQEVKKIEEGYTIRAKQLEQAIKTSCATLISQKQWRIKDLQAALQSQKQSFQKSWQQLNKKVSFIQVINTDLQNQLRSLRQHQIVIKQEHRKALKLAQQSQNKFSQTLQYEKTKLHVNFQSKITSYYDSISQQLNKEVEGIKQQQGKMLAKKQQLHATEISNLKATLNQQRQQNSRVITDYKKQIEEARRDQKNRRQQEHQISSSKINQLQAIIANLSNIVLNRSFSAVDNSRIVEAVEEKVNLFKNQIEGLQSEKSGLQEANRLLELHSKQIRQWFRNISALLNSTEAAAVLEKGQKYEIGDEDVLQSINNFSGKLQSRLSKHKIKEETQEQQIAKLGQQIRQRTKEKAEVDRAVAGLSDKVQFLEGQIRKASSERQLVQKSIKQHNSTVIRLQAQIKELQTSLAEKQADVISLREEISTLQNVKIVGYANRINQQVAKNDEIAAKLSKVQNIIATLQEQKRALSQNLADRKAENDQRLRKLQELKQQITERQRQWSLQKESETTRFRGVINQLFDNPVLDNTFDAILNYIKDHKSGSESGPFVVSTILQTTPKERGLLEGIVCKFMQYKSIKTTFLYKYDEFNKNFANYLPIKSSFDFVLLAKTKKSQIFGVISIGLGQKSRAMAFNLNSGKTFTGDSSMSSTTYDGSYLLFGQSEIRIKNSSILELVVTTRIFNTRYFSFMKEELVGAETGESVLLDALEIHRIDY